MTDAQYNLRQLVSDVGYTLVAADRLSSDLRGIEGRLRALMGAAGLTADPLFWEIDGVTDAVTTASAALETVAKLRRAVLDIDTDLLRVRGLVQRLDGEPEQGVSS
ncbi:hypothetical protein [Nocardia sp. CA-120079]|uniref:hypothetical protein n=1 Tax=Nocardia sp. CA-120079 TaxID=3239974 RepID=UPI003D986F4C